MSTPAETQPERTAPAWQRTGLGVPAVAGLLGRRAVESERPVLLVPAGTAAPTLPCSPPAEEEGDDARPLPEPRLGPG